MTVISSIVIVSEWCNSGKIYENISYIENKQYVTPKIYKIGYIRLIALINVNVNIVSVSLFGVFDIFLFEGQSRPA